MSTRVASVFLAQMNPSQSSLAIILRARVYAESDKIVTFFGADVGKLTGIAKGARNSRRRFANCLDPFTTVRVHFRLRPNASLVFMESCDLLSPPGRLADPVKLAYGSYLVELVEALTVEAEPVAGVFELLTEALDELRSGAATGGFLRAYELRLLHHTGFHPQLDACAQCRKQFATDGQAYLESKQARILCVDCREPREDLLPLHVTTLSALKTLTALPLQTARATPLDAATAEEAAELMGRLLASHLPRPLRSVRLISTLSQQL